MLTHYFLFRKRAKEHLTPPDEHNIKEYEVPYLDDDAYLMQKLWAEKEHAKERDALDDAVRRRRLTKDQVRIPRIFLLLNLNFFVGRYESSIDANKPW